MTSASEFGDDNCGVGDREGELVREDEDEDEEEDEDEDGAGEGGRRTGEGVVGEVAIAGEPRSEDKRECCRIVSMYCFQ